MIEPAVVVERDGVVARLPIVPLTELADRDRRRHRLVAPSHPRRWLEPRHCTLEHQRSLYAAILAPACNFGSTRMAELTGISADTIDWTTQWYLREEALRSANTDVVNAHFRHPSPRPSAPPRSRTPMVCACRRAESR